MENWPRKLSESDYQDAEAWMGSHEASPTRW
jgi:hypothetical protein